MKQSKGCPTSLAYRATAFALARSSLAWFFREGRGINNHSRTQIENPTLKDTYAFKESLFEESCDRYSIYSFLDFKEDHERLLAFLHIRLSNAYLTSLPYSSLIKWNESRYCTLLERDPTSIVIPSYRRELGMLSA